MSAVNERGKSAGFGAHFFSSTVASDRLRTAKEGQRFIRRLQRRSPGQSTVMGCGGHRVDDLPAEFEDCMIRFIDGYCWWPLRFVLLISLLCIGCRGGFLGKGNPEFEDVQQKLLEGVFTPQDAPPEYILLDGYPVEYQEAIGAGIDVARKFLGNHGPVRVYILGKSRGEVGTTDSRAAFVEQYCGPRNKSTIEGFDEDCLAGPGQRLIDAAIRGDQEAYLSIVIFTDPPYAELVFINSHEWGEQDMPLRGIHEYTHVFQHQYPSAPGWLTEGGAVFFEAWLGDQNQWVDFRGAMRRSMKNALTAVADEKGLSDMEYLLDLPQEMEAYHRNIAYDMGAWAVAFIIANSSEKSISEFRDRFYPSMRDEGWKEAVSRFTGSRDLGHFYSRFDEFLQQSSHQQMELLDAIQP
ncbi:MAG: hypothetical protein HN598_05055 [Planctomycetes bacterium]|jgi:hypothetical protein|nr:hypothetical protein [Planctomycetota bacterium]MBT7639834.1 hypothetical protein [Planctomycetota bacterium]